MEIEFQNSKIDFIRYYKLHYKKELKKKLVVIITVSLSIGFIIGTEPFNWLNFLLGVTVSAFLLVGISYLIPYSVAIKRLNNTILKEKSFFEKKKLIATESGLIVQSESKTTTWNWQYIASYHVTDEFIYLILVDKRYFLIPKRLFSSENQTLEFLGFIHNGLLEAGRKENIVLKENSRINKPPYLLGLLCFVPFLGVLVCIALILYGIFKYKDKMLVFIGSIGLVVSGLFVIVGIYIILFFQMKLSADVGSLSKNVSQIQLNSLVKEIEFYKIQNGTYPISLEQIEGSNSMNNIYDPLQTHKERLMDTKYNYQKVGNKYYLFSSGVDGIPHTEDDLYPNVQNLSTSEIGLIIAK